MLDRNSNIDLAVADTSAALFDQVLLGVISDKNKASVEKLQHQVDSCERESKKERYIT